MRFAMILAAAAMLVSSPAAIAQPGEDDEAKARAVQAHVDAYRSGNLDRFVATFTPDATVVANGIVANGRDQIAALYTLNFAPGAPRIRVVDSGITGERVFLSISYTFPGGGERCCSYSEYVVKNGKIAYLSTRG